MKLALIDSGSGNLHSAARACEYMMGEADIKGKISLTTDSASLNDASHIILPGVGAFADCLEGIGGLDGKIVAELHHQIFDKGKAFLGICVGMQLLVEKSFEFGEHRGFGWIAGRSCIFPSSAPPAPNKSTSLHESPLKQQTKLKIPHMGWNNLRMNKDKSSHYLCRDIADGSDVYFVHSYRLEGVAKSDIVAFCDYGESFPAWILRDNIVATQFHPEKSQKIGLTLLRNFMRWDI